jgi:SAM-dependent methyltransferase
MNKVFLHVGCGNKRKDKTTRGFNTAQWDELRFDIDVRVFPDYVGSVTDMSKINNHTFDAIYSSHNIEHLYMHEVDLALKEFIRVLKADGFAVLTCPDLQSIAALVAEDKLMEPAYISPAGAISPIDIIFGHRAMIAQGNSFMAHRSGFTKSVLTKLLLKNGFATVISKARGYPFFDIWAIGSVGKLPDEQIRKLAENHFP